MLRSSTMFAALALTLVATACDDPAEGKPKAKVEDAAPADAKKDDAKAAAKKDDAAKSTAYAVNLESSKLGFVGSKVTGSHEGGFKTFTAEMTPADGKAEGGSVKVEIDVDSMFSDDDKLTGHLKSPDFFDAGAHPKATFDSTALKAGGSEGYSHTVEGNLMLHGVTKKVTFPANIEVAGDKMTVKSEFSINRKDFKMEYAGKADDLIRDDVVIKLDLAFDKKA
ncbi:MAG: YceI family protein [Myxococcota bacterium]